MSKLPTEFVDLDELKVAYTQYGSGRNLLLLHGNSGSKRMFEQYQLKYFSAFHTYAIDSRGHGQSRSRDKELSIRQISDDVIRFCKAKEIGEAAVIGYSDGGNIALFLAKNAPEVFTKVITISPNTLVSGTTDESLKLFRNMMKTMKLFHMRKSLMRFELMMRDFGISDEELADIHTKMVILYAEREMIKEEHIQHIASLIPNAQLIKITNCSHMSICRSPEAVRVMQEFLTA
jgi:pimeloyl-ACP methyl ester carboxylesterase